MALRPGLRSVGTKLQAARQLLHEDSSHHCTLKETQQKVLSPGSCGGTCRGTLFITEHHEMLSQGQRRRGKTAAGVRAAMACLGSFTPKLKESSWPSPLIQAPCIPPQAEMLGDGYDPQFSAYHPCLRAAPRTAAATEGQVCGVHGLSALPARALGWKACAHLWACAHLCCLLPSASPVFVSAVLLSASVRSCPQA